MSTADIPKTSYPSTPPSNGGSGEILQSGFQQLLQHNARTAFPRDNFDYDEGVQIPSGTQSQFGSPATIYQDDRYYYHGQHRPYPYHQHHDSGLGIHFENYPIHVNRMSRGYGPLPNDGPIYQSQYEAPPHTSPTPDLSTPGSDAIRTRSGLKVSRTPQTLKPLPRTTTRISKVTKSKRVKKEKVKAEKRVAKLEKPLSELTKAWTHVPVVDIEAYVNRSAEERRREVEDGKFPGRVKRPMNCFMLYRMAYQNRTKNWCLQNNHQVVSQVCGDSWPLEPEELREKFKEWARVERQNHQNAHPGYKFSPSKPGVGKNPKPKFSEEPESDDSDLDDYDWERGDTKRRKKKKIAANTVRHVVRQPTASPYSNYSRESSVEPGLIKYHTSSYQASNPERPVPPQYNQSNLLRGQYYQQTVHPNTSNPNVEDVVIKKTVAPGMQYIGHPSGYEYALTGQYLSREGMATPDQKIDPSLMAHGLPNYGETYAEEDIYGGNNIGSEPQWQPPYMQSDREDSLEYLGAHRHYDSSEISGGHELILKGNQDDWQVETLNAGQEFESWMDDA